MVIPKYGHNRTCNPDPSQENRFLLNSREFAVVVTWLWNVKSGFPKGLLTLWLGGRLLSKSPLTVSVQISNGGMLGPKGVVLKNPISRMIWLQNFMPPCTNRVKRLGYVSDDERYLNYRLVQWFFRLKLLIFWIWDQTIAVLATFLIESGKKKLPNGAHRVKRGWKPLQDSVGCLTSYHDMLHAKLGREPQSLLELEALCCRAAAQTNKTAAERPEQKLIYDDVFHTAVVDRRMARSKSQSAQMLHCIMVRSD